MKERREKKGGRSKKCVKTLKKVIKTLHKPLSFDSLEKRNREGGCGVE